MNDDKLKKLISKKHMVILTIPIFIELFLQMVVGYCDQIMISDYPNAVNGITNANVVISMIITVFSVMSSAAIILITQYKGLNDKDKEDRVYPTAFWFNFVCSLMFSLIIITTSKYYLNWMKTPTSAYKDALIYSMICGGFIIFQTMSTTMSALLKANNLMKESMYVNIIVNILNIIGNFFLISLFAKYNLAIVGVALSSAISRLVGFILMFIIYKKKIGISLHFKILLQSKKTLNMLLKIGLPSGGEGVSYSSSQIVIQLVVNQIVNANAGNVGIGNIKVYASMFAMITYMATLAIAQSMQVIIGQLLGASKTKNVDKLVKQTLFFSSVTSLVIATTFYLLSDNIFAIFNVKDLELLRIAKMVMLIEIGLELGRAFNIIFVRALQTAGDVMFPTTTAIIFCWVVAVGGSFVLGGPNALNLGLAGIWLAMMIDELTRGVIFVIRWQKGKWKTKNIAMI